MYIISFYVMNLLLRANSFIKKLCNCFHSPFVMFSNIMQWLKKCKYKWYCLIYPSVNYSLISAVGIYHDWQNFNWILLLAEAASYKVLLICILLLRERLWTRIKRVNLNITSGVSQSVKYVLLLKFYLFMYVRNLLCNGRWSHKSSSRLYLLSTIRAYT